MRPLQGKEHPGLLANQQKLGEGQGRFHHMFRGKRGPLRPLASRAVRPRISIALTHLVCGTLLRQGQESNRECENRSTFSSPGKGCQF